LLDALAADDIDTDCNGVITMANLTVTTMTTTRRRPLSQEEIEALIDLRIAQLRVFAAQTGVDWWRSREHERDERIRRLPLTRGRSWACVADRSLGTTGIRPNAGRASGAISS
jgi:integrase